MSFKHEAISPGNNWNFVKNGFPASKCDLLKFYYVTSLFKISCNYKLPQVSAQIAIFRKQPDLWWSFASKTGKIKAVFGIHKAIVLWNTVSK